MDVARCRLVRQHHELIVDLNSSRKYILGRDMRRNEDLDEISHFVRCVSEFVSRKHCDITCDIAGVWKIRDMESMNGTFLNNIKLMPQHLRELRDGDLIGLGIAGTGQPGEEIDIRDARYFTFKFEEPKKDKAPELIDITDEDPTADAVPVPSRVPHLQKKTSKVSSRSSSRDRPQKENSNSVHPSSSRSISSGNINIGKEKSRKVYPPSSLDLIPSESEDDSSDGCSSDRNQVLKPSTNRMTHDGDVPKQLLKSTNSTIKKEEKSSHKPKQSSNQVSKRTMDQTPLNPKPRVRLNEHAENSNQFQCYVKLKNIFQVNQHGQVVLLPSIKKKLTSVGCSFSQKPYEEENVNSTGYDAICHSKIKKEHENGIMVVSTSPVIIANVPATVGLYSNCVSDIIDISDIDSPHTSTEDTIKSPIEKKRLSKENSNDKGAVNTHRSNKKPKQCFNKIKVVSDSEDDDDFEKTNVGSIKRQGKEQLQDTSKKTNVVPPLLRDNDVKKTSKPLSKPVEDEAETLPNYSKRLSSDEIEEAMDYEDAPLEEPSDDEDDLESETTIEYGTVETYKLAKDEHLSRIVSHNRTKLPQRQIKIIGDVPAPFSRRKKGLGTEARVSAIPSGAVPAKKSGTEWRFDAFDAARRTKEERFERKRKLKAAAEKQNLKMLENRQEEEVFKKPKFIPKVKVSNQTRGAALLKDMVESAKGMDAIEDNEPEAGCSKDLLPQRDFPSIEEQSKMPLFGLLKSELKMPAIPNDRPTPAAIVQPIAIRDNLMQKPNAAVGRRSEDRVQTNQFHINNKKPIMAGPKSRVTQMETKLFEETIYQHIGEWNPIWLEEQKKFQTPPSVETGSGWPIIRTLNCYSNYTAYQSTFYPLMLHELWAAISEDIAKNSRLLGYESNIAIDKINILDYCPVVTPHPASRKTVWHELRCHSYACSMAEIRKDLDLCILQHAAQRDGQTHLRHIFGHIMIGPRGNELIEEIKSTTVLNNNLHKFNPNFRYKHSFSVFYHDRKDFTDSLKVDMLCSIQKIAYIYPKIRDYKAFISLPKFLLYQNILLPSKIENPWTESQLEPTNANLVSYCTSLNPRQKSMVNYISKRIMTLKEPDIMLIHGPPGTGKTKTIIGLILQLVTSQDYKATSPKILVCTPSNTAIDEIVSRLHEHLKDMAPNKRPRMIRLGDSCKKTEISIQYNPDVMARKQMSKNSALDSIEITIKDKREEIKRKQIERKEVAANNNNIRLKALDREIKEAECEIASLERNKREVLSTTNKNHEVFNKSVMEIIKGADIVCSTLSACSGRGLKSSFEMVSKSSGLSKVPLSKFTCCIIDEATQTTEPETLTPLMFNIKKLVMLGDPQQLDATVLSKKSRENRYEFSLFHRLYTAYSSHDPNPVMMLKDQYRMHSEILKWPNDYFYGANLLQRPIRKQNLECPLPPYAFFNLSSQESSNNKGEISNEQETTLVIELLKCISVQLNASKNNFNIGVITPYSKQKIALTDEIKKKAQSLNALVEVDTVDSFQGREKDIIIISCVRTESFGFLTSPKRLNVALTRAIHSLFIIGNADFLKTNEMWESLIEDAESRKFLYEIPKDKARQPSYLAKFFHPILSSPTKSEIQPDRQMR